jgi:hypothetical protein
VSIEDEKSSSLSERCEVFLMTGARTCLIFGEVSGMGTGWTEGVPGFAPGTTVVAL